MDIFSSHLVAYEAISSRYYAFGYHLGAQQGQ